MKLFARASFFVVIAFVLFVAGRARAQEFQSANFRSLDPVIFPASYSTSSNFQLHSTISQVAISTSTATSFRINSGFLYFPFVSKPTPTAAAGDSQVSLTWTAASGVLGWSVAGYSVGQSVASGGPYTYSSVGNVLTSVRTGLTNGTTYYFVITVNDTFGNRIATSTQVSGAPSGSASPPPPPPPPAGGGGGPPGLVSLPSSPKVQPKVPIVIIPRLDEERSPDCRSVAADINCDGKVNLVDFSIMYYWYELPLVPKRVDLNADRRVNIFDFSIMAFYWSE